MNVSIVQSVVCVCVRVHVQIPVQLQLIYSLIMLDIIDLSCRTHTSWEHI